MKPHTYSIASHGDMIADRLRMNAYVDALRQSITPNSVVLDIGAGVGIFSLLACRFGARQVYAVEPDDSIFIARDIASANGYKGRIQFIQDLSTKISLPERADVIVSDIRGTLPMFQHHIESIVDARSRHMARGGILIPARDTINTALAECPDIYNSIISPWEEGYESVQLSAGRHYVINDMRKVRLSSEHLLSSPQEVITWDYATVTDPDVHRELSLPVSRTGTLHGILFWFDAFIAKDAGYSNAPGLPGLVYGQLLFPLDQPVNVVAGDRVSVDFHAKLVTNDYRWSWETIVLDQGSHQNIKAHFRQSTTLNQPAPLQTLMHRPQSVTPILDKHGVMEYFVLSQMDGHTTIQEIAQRLLEQFPNQVASQQEALQRVGELSQSFSN
jgi:type I protein arginine methyltransferase